MSLLKGFIGDVSIIPAELLLTSFFAAVFSIDSFFQADLAWRDANSLPGVLLPGSEKLGTSSTLWVLKGYGSLLKICFPSLPSTAYFGSITSPDSDFLVTVSFLGSGFPRE